VVTAVLAGLVNKEITAAINLFGGKAVGISGVDGSLIESAIKSKEMGYVGSVDKVNVGILETLLKAGFMPVVSPISLYSVDRAGEEPGVINVNGDPIAGEIAVALKAKRLIFLTDVDGIQDKSGKTISQLSEAVAETLISSGAIVGGMIPKVDACLDAFNTGAIARIIDGRKPHALLQEIDKSEGGTTIVRNPPALKLERTSK
jgi:acetylglutamate kinase